MKKSKLAKTKKPTLQSGLGKSKVEKSLLGVNLSKKGFSMVNKNKLTKIKVQWLIDDFLLKGSLNMFYASAGQGKSLFTAHLCKFLLENKLVSSVYYFDGDNSVISLKKRNYDEFLDPKHFHYALPNLSQKYELFDTLLKSKFKPNTLIVIDSIRNFISGDLNSDKAVMQELNKLQALRDNKKVSVIFLHHQPKQMDGENNKAYKGSTSFADSVDEDFFLTKINHKDNPTLKEHESIILLESQKKRNNPKPMAFKLDALNHSLKITEWANFAMDDKTKYTIEFVREILSEKGPLCEKDLATEIEKRANDVRKDVLARNAFWRFLREKEGELIESYYEPIGKGCLRKKMFMLKN